MRIASKGLNDFAAGDLHRHAVDKNPDYRGVCFNVQQFFKRSADLCARQRCSIGCGNVVGCLVFVSMNSNSRKVWEFCAKRSPPVQRVVFRQSLSMAGALKVWREVQMKTCGSLSV